MGRELQRDTYALREATPASSRRAAYIANQNGATREGSV
jgi:hypothetical protein